MSEESRLSAIQRYTRVFSDTYANLPVTNVRTGELGYATDRRILYRWSGAAWVDLTIYSDSGAIATIPTAANLPEGSLFYATDTLELWQVQAATWMKIVSDVIYSGADVIGDIPAAGTVAEGSFFYATDTKEFYQVQAGAWVKIIEAEAWRLIGSASPSGVATITVTIAAHDLIKVYFKVTHSNAAGIMRLRLNEETGNLYGYRQVDGTTISVAAAQTSIPLVEHANLEATGGMLLISGKAVNSDKGVGFVSIGNAHSDVMLLNGRLDGDSDNLTKITLFDSSSTFTGKVQVYGKNF